MNIMIDMQRQKMSDLGITTLSNKEQKKFAFFRYFMDYPFSGKELIKFFPEEKGLTRLYYFARIISEIKQNHLSEKISIDYEATKSYNNILQECKKLSQELKLNSSLEIANLYTYLLWNGYFSKDKSLIFQPSDRAGIFSTDIMDGIGVCLNFSDMLTDFINEFDFSSATIINYMNNSCKDTYNINLKRQKCKENILSKITSLIPGSLERVTGNHAFNLIKENDKIYIYDSTNLAISKIDSKFESTYLSGKGIIKLKPYHSYVMSFSQKSTNTLDYLHNQTSYECPYNEVDFSLIWDKCFELFSDNMSLLDDFYDDVRKDIVNVSQYTHKVKKLTK